MRLPSPLAGRIVPFRSRVKVREAHNFNLSRRDKAEALAAPERVAPSISQAKRAFSRMPASTPHELRDKAVFSLLCLTGIRVGEVRELAVQDKNGGRWWLEPKMYDRDEFREAWDRIRNAQC